MTNYDKYKIDVVLDVMREFAETDDYFANALREYFNADDVAIENMNNMLIEIFDEHVDTGISIETLVILSCYNE